MRALDSGGRGPASFGAQHGCERCEARVAREFVHGHRQLAPPVRETVFRRARHVHLQQLAGDVFELHADEPRRRAGQVRVHGVDERRRRIGHGGRLHGSARRQQRLVFQREQQPRAVLGPAQHVLLARGFVRVQVQPREHFHVFAEPEAPQRRQVVRADHGQRLRVPLRGRLERAVLRALEQQRPVRKQRFLGHRLAHARRHVAQVLADHHALVPVAFQCEDREHLLERIAHVGAVAFGGPEKAHERHDVIEPERAGMAHVRAQGFDPRLELRMFERERVDRRQAPVLPQCVQRIGRRAHVHAQRIQPRLHPHFRAAFVRAHGEIAIQAQAHAAVARIALDAFQLRLGQPLQPQPELHVRFVLARERLHAFGIHVPVFLRPRGPAPDVRVLPVEMRLQGFEERVAAERVLALFHESFEPGAARRALAELVRLEVPPQHQQHFLLRRGHAGVVDELAVAQRLQTLLERIRIDVCRGLAASALVEEQLHVEVDRVQRIAARWAVRACHFGPVRKESMQRRQADERCALARGDLHQPAQVAEVADAPVVGGAQRVQLHGAAPPALAGFERRGHPAARGRHDDRARWRLRFRGDHKPPITAFQIRGQLDRVIVARAGHLARAQARARRSIHRVQLPLAPARRAAPFDARTRAFGHHAKARKAAGARLRRVLVRDAHGLQRAAQHVFADLLVLAPEAAVVQRDAAPLGQLGDLPGYAAHACRPRVHRAAQAGQ